MHKYCALLSGGQRVTSAPNVDNDQHVLVSAESALTYWGKKQQQAKPLQIAANAAEQLQY